MDCETSGSITICGNFAELLLEKPKDFHYDTTAKWVEPYSFEWRETLGSTVCNCKQIECWFTPYYGHDYYHQKTCNLMRKLAAEPQIANLYETYLPHITRYDSAVPNSDKIQLYIQSISRIKHITVRHSPAVDTRQVVLL